MKSFFYSIVLFIKCPEMVKNASHSFFGIKVSSLSSFFVVVQPKPKPNPKIFKLKL